MDIKWILLATCMTILVFGSNAKKTKFDKLAEKSESSEMLESYESKSENSKEKLQSGQKTKNYGIQEPNEYSKGRKVKKYDDDAWEKYPQKNKKGKKHNGKSSEEYSEKNSRRNKRDASKRMWDGIEMPRTRLTKIKKKELMDQENTDVDGEMMAPFESEIVFERFERPEKLEPDQTASMPKSPSDEIVPAPKKSKSIKKYNHLEGVKKGKMYKEGKSEKHAKVDKSFKEKPSVDNLTNEIGKP